MIVEIVGTPANWIGPVHSVTMQLKDHPMAEYSKDQLQVKILDHASKVVAGMSISRKELCRAVRAFEVQQQTDREDAT